MSTAHSRKLIDILLIEDSRADVRLTVEALRHATISNNLFTARDGQDALDMLRGHGRYMNPVQPDLILLDLNLPTFDGRDVLAKIKSDDTIKQIPVIVLTNSEREDDVLATYRAHANCYIIKPIDFDEFVEVVKLIEAFWLRCVRLPSAHDEIGARA